MMKALRGAALLLVVLLLIGGAARADEPWVWGPVEQSAIAKMQEKVKERRGSLWLETRHWTVNTYADPRFTAELALFMEGFRGLFSNLLSGRPVVTVKPTIVVFPTRKAYREKNKHTSPGSRGQFRYRFTETGEFSEFHLYTYQGEGEDGFADFYRPVLLHEGTHALLQLYLGTISSPAWFTEGLAEHFEYWDLRQDGEANRKVCRRMTARRLHRYALSGTPMPLQQILELDRNTWNPDEGGPVGQQNYATAAAFVDFLVSDPERKETLVTVFRRLSEGVSPKRVLNPKEIRALEPAWNEHWRRLFYGAR